MRELYGSKTLIRGRRIKYCRLGAYCLESVNADRHRPARFWIQYALYGRFSNILIILSTRLIIGSYSDDTLWDLSAGLRDAHKNFPELGPKLSKFCRSVMWRYMLIEERNSLCIFSRLSSMAPFQITLTNSRIGNIRWKLILNILGMIQDRKDF